MSVQRVALSKLPSWQVTIALPHPVLDCQLFGRQFLKSHDARSQLRNPARRLLDGEGTGERLVLVIWNASSLHNKERSEVKGERSWRKHVCEAGRSCRWC